jgi:hypothetical protein
MFLDSATLHQGYITEGQRRATSSVTQIMGILAQVIYNNALFLFCFSYWRY